MITSVQSKLGMKLGMTGFVHNRPADLAALLPLPESPNAGLKPDLVIPFVRARSEVQPAVDRTLPFYSRGRLLWLCYPKKTGAIATDITRDSGWEPLSAHGLLPVAQIAIDATWSALHFRFRDEIKMLTRKLA